MELFRQIHGVSIRDRVLVYKPIQKILLCDSGPMLISKNLVTPAKAGALWQTWIPAFAGKTKWGVALNDPNASKQ